MPGLSADTVPSPQASSVFQAEPLWCKHLHKRDLSKSSHSLELGQFPGSCPVWPQFPSLLICLPQKQCGFQLKHPKAQAFLGGGAPSELQFLLSLDKVPEKVQRTPPSFPQNTIPEVSFHLIRLLDPDWLPLCLKCRFSVSRDFDTLTHDTACFLRKRLPEDAPIGLLSHHSSRNHGVPEDPFQDGTLSSLLNLRWQV